MHARVWLSRPQKLFIGTQMGLQQLPGVLHSGSMIPVTP